MNVSWHEYTGNILTTISTLTSTITAAVLNSIENFEIRGLTWRRVAIGAIVVVFGMTGAWALDMRLTDRNMADQLNKIREQNALILSRLSGIDAAYTYVETRLNYHEMRINQLELNERSESNSHNGSNRVRRQQ